MISVIVLAAGQGARFGQCKPLIRLGEKPLLEHVLDTVHASKVRDVVVVLGAQADEIRQGVRFGGERIVINPDYAVGVSTSIRAGLNALPQMCQAAIFALADQPFVKPQTIDALADEYARTQAPIVVPTYKEARGNPVLIDRALFSEMMEIHGDIGFRAIFGKYEESIARLPVDDVGIVTDLDRHDDLPA